MKRFNLILLLLFACLVSSAALPAPAAIDQNPDPTKRRCLKITVEIGLFGETWTKEFKICWGGGSDAPGMSLPGELELGTDFAETDLLILNSSSVEIHEGDYAISPGLYPVKHGKRAEVILQRID